MQCWECKSGEPPGSKFRTYAWTDWSCDDVGLAGRSPLSRTKEERK
jgi:hypothetical protein